MARHNKQFWSWFDEIESLMPLRAVSWRKAFQYLDTLPAPIVIVETGCAREIGNWAGDGQSTLLFDRYVQARGGRSRVYSVDINPDGVAACQAQVSDRVTVSCQESVCWLASLNGNLPAPVSMVYLDSMDVDWLNTMPSACHHLQELAAIRPSITTKTLVMVDDSPARGHVWMKADGSLDMIGPSSVGGKGRLVAEYALRVSARMEFIHYQIAWTGMA